MPRIVRDLYASAHVSVEEELALLAPAGGGAQPAAQEVERRRAKLAEIMKVVKRAHLMPPQLSSTRNSLKSEW